MPTPRPCILAPDVAANIPCAQPFSNRASKVYHQPVETSTDARTIAQAILTGPWRDAARALAACQSRSWADFVDGTAPPRPGLFKRGEHRACIEMAKQLFEGPREEVIDIYPVWIGDSPDEGPARDWCIGHASRLASGPVGVCGTGPHDRDATPALNHRTTCRVRTWDVGHVVLTRNYSPEIELAHRGGQFGVLRGEVTEVLDATPLPGEALPRPALEVPPFSVWFEPRVTGLSAALVAEIRKLSITTDSEGNLISRPGV